MALRDKAHPGALAADLAKATDKLNVAQARYEAERKAVIERGTTRVAQIVELQKQLSQEQADIQSVVASA